MNRHVSKEDTYAANKHETKLIITGHQRNANQNHNEIPFKPVRIESLKSLETTDAGKNVE